MPEQTNQNQTIDIQEELLNRYEALPQDLKETMMSVETAETIFEIGKKFGLNIEKTGKLAEEIGFVILGVIPSKDFVGNLKGILEIDADKAFGVASEVNHRIFLKIREALKTLHGARWVDQIDEKPIDLTQNKPFGAAQGGPFESPERQVKVAETIEKNKKQIPSILVEIRPTEEQLRRPPNGGVGAPTEASEPTTEESPQPILTEIKPEIATQKIPTVPLMPAPLDTAHEIAAPRQRTSSEPQSNSSVQAPATNSPASAEASVGRQQPIADNRQPPEMLPVEQLRRPPDGGVGAPTEASEPTPTPAGSGRATGNQQPKKYLVDPYKEPFE